MNRVQFYVYYWPSFTRAIRACPLVSSVLEAKKGVNFYDIVEQD